MTTLWSITLAGDCIFWTRTWRRNEYHPTETSLKRLYAVLRGMSCHIDLYPGGFVAKGLPR